MDHFQPGIDRFKTEYIPDFCAAPRFEYNPLHYAMPQFCRNKPYELDIAIRINDFLEVAY